MTISLPAASLDLKDSVLGRGLSMIKFRRRTFLREKVSLEKKTHFIFHFVTTVGLDFRYSCVICSSLLRAFTSSSARNENKFTAVIKLKQ